MENITVKVNGVEVSVPKGATVLEAAHKAGFNENMYLDAKTRTKVEETGGANFVFVTKDGKMVTPKSPSILPSILPALPLFPQLVNYPDIIAQSKIVVMNNAVDLSKYIFTSGNKKIAAVITTGFWLFMVKVKKYPLSSSVSVP